MKSKFRLINLILLSFTLFIMIFIQACHKPGVSTGGSNSETPVYYTVIVDGVSQSVLEGEKAVEPTRPTQEGYTFDKWVSEGVEFTFETLIYKNYVVESTFTKDPVYYTVTVDGVSQSVLEGEKAVEPTRPTQEGYTFDKWVSEGVEFTFETLIYKNYVVESTFTKDPVYYTVTVDGVSQSVLDGETAVEPEIPTKENYTFEKWMSNNEEFFFSTPIHKDYIVTSSFVLTLDITEKASNMNHLIGGFANLNGKYVSKEDGSLSSFNDVSMKNGSITVTVKSEKGYVIYFGLDSKEVYRGKPQGNYYALSVDEFGNVSLSRAVDGHEVVVNVSLAIKDTYNPENEYTFGIYKTNKNIDIYYNNQVIISYRDNISFNGYNLAISAENKASEFNFTSIAPQTSVDVIDGTLYFADANKHNNFVVTIEGQDYEVGLNKYSIDLDALQLENKVYNGSVYSMDGTNKTLLLGFEYGRETTINNFKNYNGEFVLYGNTYYYSKESFSLGLFTDKEFLDGTLKTKVIPGNNEDVGLVFRASNGGLESFWEDPTAQYYTALINKEGIVILGKVNYNGNVWSLLGSKAMVDAYSSLNEYELEVRTSAGRIMVFVNGIKYVDVVDNDPYTYTGVGIRTTTSNTKFRDVQILEPSIVGLTVKTFSDQVKVNEEINLNNIKAYVEYDNGSLEEVNVTKAMLSDTDTSIVGKKAIILTYSNSVSTYDKEFFLYVVDDSYVYYKDFADDENSSVLPEGWYVQQGGPADTVYKIENGGLVMGCTSKNFPAAIQFDGIDMDNYTVIVEFEVLEKMDDGRWLGISTRLQETAGWYKGSVSLNGNLAINNCTTTDLSKPVWVQAVKETYDFDVELNTIHTMQLSIIGQYVIFYYDDYYVTHTLPEPYTTGGFGITIGGTVIKVHKIMVKEPSAADFKRVEGISTEKSNSTINQGEELELDVILTNKDGSQRILDKSEYTIEGFNNNEPGEHTFSIKYGNYEITHTVKVLATEVIETYYEADFTNVDSSTNLPVGWTWKAEDTKVTYSTSSEGIAISSLKSTPQVSLQYTDSSFTASDYTYEMQIKVVDYQNTSRWFGLTSRGTEEYGYVRSHVTINGASQYGRQSNWNIAPGNIAKTSTSVKGGTFAKIQKGQVVTLKLVVFGSQFALYVDGQLMYIGSYEHSSFGTGLDYSQGTFGFTCGGGSYLIQSISVKSVSQMDKEVFNTGA